MAGRRLLTIPGYLAAWILCVGLAPVWIPVAAVVDVWRHSPGVALRSAALVTAYLSWEVAGLAAVAALWTRKRIAGIDREHWLDLHYRLSAWWGAKIFGSVVRLFSLRVEIEDDANLAQGPYLLLIRHSSSADTMLALALVSRAHGMHVRYVIKRELLWDPCIDIVGHRLPNVFIDRFSDQPAKEIHRIQELAPGMGGRDALLIYPEGTRFSKAKRERVLDGLRRRGDAKMLEYARSLECVLPPRPGGVLGLLEAAPQVDVVVCAHTGFEGAASLEDVWRGALIHRTIRIRFQRIPWKEIPGTSDARSAWLLDEWRKVDAWVARHRAS